MKEHKEPENKMSDVEHILLENAEDGGQVVVETMSGEDLISQNERLLEEMNT